VAYADGGRERYTVPCRDGSECAPDDPLWPALARAAGLPAESDERGRAVATDLSNTVVALDASRGLVKLYRRPEAGPHPEAELLAALDGCPEAPALLGALEHEGATLVVVQALVDGVPVGWEGLIARLAEGDEAVGDPGELARVAARLHRRLGDRLGTGPGPASGAPPAPLPAELSALRPAVEERLSTVRGATLEVQRVHGDLHVGQFLRAAGGLVVVDWEGEPGRSLAERSRPRPAARDLASLRLSLAHAAVAAHRREPRFDWRAWAAAARREALEAYRDEGGRADADVLAALEVDKELSELDYAARWLPEWLYAPRAVLPFVLEEQP
jgi:maltokinase